MGHSAAERLGKLPTAAGTITRLAYAHAKVRDSSSALPRRHASARIDKHFVKKPIP